MSNIKGNKFLLLSMGVSIFIYGIILCGVNDVNAFGMYESGSSVIRPDWQIYVDGTQIDNLNEKFIIRTNKPIIFGYSVNNVKINLLLSRLSQDGADQSIEENTDSNGYWIHSINTEIPAGDYTLSYTLTDSSGVTTASELAATFHVPEKLPDKQSIQSIVNIPQPSFKKLDYLTGPLIIFIVIAMIGLIYILLKRINHE